jgi:hypothetical protein
VPRLDRADVLFHVPLDAPRGGFSFALSKEVIDGLSDLSATIRRYRDSDKAAVYDVCVRTANAGRGVGGRYSTR